MCHAKADSTFIQTCATVVQGGATSHPAGNSCVQKSTASPPEEGPQTTQGLLSKYWSSYAPGEITTAQLVRKCIRAASVDLCAAGKQLRLAVSYA